MLTVHNRSYNQDYWVSGLVHCLVFCKDILFWKLDLFLPSSDMAGRNLLSSVTSYCHLLLTSSNPVLNYCNDPHSCINTHSWSIINHILLYILSQERGLVGLYCFVYTEHSFDRNIICNIRETAYLLKRLVYHDFAKNFLIDDMTIKISCQVLKKAIWWNASKITKSVIFFYFSSLQSIVDGLVVWQSV
jgi:hypothetical protein